jgi:carotenoid cleavage dioxygenase
MNSIVETAIRGTITKGLSKISGFNRARAKNTQGPHPFLTGIYTPLKAELTLEALIVDGNIPAELNGTYLKNGPNPAGNPNPARYHWFTGDGMVHGVRIENGRAFYRNRWVRTTQVSDILHEPPAPGPRLFEAAVNTNIIQHAGRYWALVEAGGTPVELDDNLATIAHNPFGGTLRGAFSAHPHRDPATGELHAICYLATDMEHVHHVVVTQDGIVRREEPVAVNHGPSIHDTAITARYVLIFDLPVTFSMPAMLAGFEFPYRWNAEHRARIGLLPPEGAGTEVIWCDVDPCYVYHVANAHDAADGRVIADVVVHNRSGYRDFRAPDAEDISFERWVIDPVTQSVSRTILDARAQEFPRIDERLTGLPHRFVYAAHLPAGGAINPTGGHVIFKHDLRDGTAQTHDFGPNGFPGEFVFIPRSAEAAEDDGWLMGFVVNTDTETTDLTILMAQDFTGPPVARVRLPHIIPPGFHGNWAPALTAQSGSTPAG